MNLKKDGITEGLIRRRRELLILGVMVTKTREVRCGIRRFRTLHLLAIASDH